MVQLMYPWRWKKEVEVLWNIESGNIENLSQEANSSKDISLIILLVNVKCKKIFLKVFVFVSVCDLGHSTFHC